MLTTGNLGDRLRDPVRWKAACRDIAIGFMACWVLFEAMARLVPGYPVLVGTASIPTGLYWLDKTRTPSRGDLSSFLFEPTQPWLQERIGPGHVHTKRILGIEGDVVAMDHAGNLTRCFHNYSGRWCDPAGTVLAKDGKNRPLYSWLQPGQSYTLKAGEVWVHGEHVRSLDSRYHGPVPAASLRGVVLPVWLFAL